MDAETSMVLLTGLSVLAAFWAVAVARSSKDQAEKAVFAANAANAIAREANDLSSDSNQIAKTASEDARSAPTQVAWDEMFAAVSALLNVDPASEPIGPLLTAVRIRSTLLIDRLDWDGFDGWVVREMQYGITLMREAAIKGHEVSSPSADQMLAINEAFMTWVAGFTLNLRVSRKTGPLPDDWARLAAIARQGTRDVCARNNWPEPPESVPGLKPLEDEDES